MYVKTFTNSLLVVGLFRVAMKFKGFDWLFKRSSILIKWYNKKKKLWDAEVGVGIMYFFYFDWWGAPRLKFPVSVYFFLAETGQPFWISCGAFGYTDEMEAWGRQRGGILWNWCWRQWLFSWFDWWRSWGFIEHTT